MLKSKINESREIKANSLSAYMISLRKIHSGIETKIKFDDIKWLLKIDKIKVLLMKLKLSTRKNYLTSIIVALMTDPKKHKKLISSYRTIMDDTVAEYNELMKTQELSETQAENWATMEELKAITTKLARIKAKILIKPELDMKDLAVVQEHLVASLYTNLPPLRNDYAGMIIKKESDYNQAEDKENYLIEGTKGYYFVLNQYKTAKTYGSKKIEVPKLLEYTIRKWLEVNPTDYFLINNKFKPLSPNSLTKLLNKIFASTGKKISSSMIRHIYLSNKYDAVLEEQEKDAGDMLHSVAVQQGVYVKKQPLK